MHSLSPPGSSAHQPDPAAGAVHHEGEPADRRRPVRAHLGADVEVILVARIGTSTRIEWTLSLSTFSLNCLPTWMRAASAPSAGELKPARPRSSRASRSRSKRSPSRSARRRLAERSEPAVGDDDAEAVDVADQLDARLARFAQPQVERRGRARRCACRTAARGSGPACPRRSSRPSGSTASFVARRPRPGRGSIAAFHVPAPPS